MPARRPILLLAATLALAVAAPAHAERSDRSQPLNIVADREGRVDLLNQTIVFNGNVVITKGSIVIRAARVEVRESAAGYHTASAFGASGAPASFRQKREGLDEFIEGWGERLEYDERADTVRFIGGATMRRLRGATVADEIVGSLITYDNRTEVFSAAGAPASGATDTPGRVRAVLAPRPGTAAAAEAAAAASQPAVRLRPSAPPSDTGR